jgi:hypothetical protein
MSLEQALASYMENIKADYNRWMYVDRSKTSSDTVRSRMVEEFNNDLSYTVGKKYIKVVVGTRVHSFIVAGDNDKKFRKGDILMAASWAAPAKNKARGNLFENYKISWTGAEYLN